jgi:DNA-binding MarR family transcriptional regulator
MLEKKPTFLPLIRELARCYQSFEHASGRHIRMLGLTTCQFDIVVTLGNTEGMNFRDLGEKTLITKGTLTGVVDRLEEKGLVTRMPDERDGRSQLVCLTAAGNVLFEEVFPAHLAYMAKMFAGVSEAELLEMRQILVRLGQILQSEVD